MKYISGILAFIAAFLFITGCDKADDLPFYNAGKPITLTADPTTVEITSDDLESGVVHLEWTNPEFATIPANYKYVIEFDTASNFATAKTLTQLAMHEKTLTGMELNNMVLQWGVPVDGAKDIYVRVKGSYLNNNDMQVSNAVTLTVTAAAVPFTLISSAEGGLTPSVANQNDLATTLTWTAPEVPGLTYTYTIEYAAAGTDFASVHEIAAGSDLSKDLSNLNVNAMAQAVGIANGSAGDVEVRIKAVSNNNQVMYSTPVTLNVTPINMTSYLYLPGDYQGWSPSSAPMLASGDGANYEGYVWVPAGGSGEFKMTSHPDWDHTNYGGTATTLDPSGGNLVWPAGTGKYYLVKANTQTMTWSATAVEWGLIGSATAGGWDNSTPLTYNPATGKWEGTVTLVDGEYKFRANNAWDINLGGSLSNLSYNGANIAGSAGTYTVSLDLSTPLNYTATVQ